MQNIELQEADVEYLNLSNESFDAILCSSAIMCLGDIPKVKKGIQIARPDFIIKHGTPYSTDLVVGEVKGDKARLIGEFKATVQKAYYTAKKKENQWLAMLNYAD